MMDGGTQLPLWVILGVNDCSPACMGLSLLYFQTDSDWLLCFCLFGLIDFFVSLIKQHNGKKLTDASSS